MTMSYALDDIRNKLKTYVASFPLTKKLSLENERISSIVSFGNAYYLLPTADSSSYPRAVSKKDIASGAKITDFFKLSYEDKIEFEQITKAIGAFELLRSHTEEIREKLRKVPNTSELSTSKILLPDVHEAYAIFPAGVSNRRIELEDMGEFQRHAHLFISKSTQKKITDFLFLMSLVS